MKLPSPMVMSGITVTPPPIITSSSMVAPRGVGIGSMRPGNRSLVKVTPGPMKTWSPTHVRGRNVHVGHHTHPNPEPYDALNRRLVHKRAVVAHLDECSNDGVVPGLKVVSYTGVAVDDRPSPNDTVPAQYRGAAVLVVAKSYLHVRLDDRPITDLRVAKFAGVESLHAALHKPVCMMPEGYHADLPLLTAL